jgi:sugar lactone lactonase YvrE
MEQFTSTTIADSLGFGEAPRWRNGRLWFSDFYRHGVFSLDPDGFDERLEVTVPGQPSGLGWTSDEELRIVSMIDHKLLAWRNEELVEIADLSAYCGFWANDMAIGSSDVAYVGNFGFDLDTLLAERGVEGLLSSPPPTTNVVVIGRDGDVMQVIPDMAFPNGTVITPDGTTLIVGETMAFRLTAFDIDGDGRLSNRRVWAQLDFVATDGMCLDSEGQIWLANALTNEVLRVAEGGEITARVSTSQTAFACMLGGEDRRTLFICTAPSSNRFEIADQRAGKIETVRVNVPGAGRP